MIKVLNIYSLLDMLDKEYTELEAINDLLNKGIIKVGIAEDSFLYESDNEKYIESALEEYKGKYYLHSLRDDISNMYNGSGACMSLKIDKYESIHVYIEEILKDSNNIPDEFLNNMYNSDNVNEYLEKEFDKIAKELLRKKINNLLDNIDSCSLWD